VRARLLLVSKALSFGVLALFMAAWAAGVLLNPAPHWLFIAMFALSPIGMASILLYNVANRSFTDPIERPVHRELETPTTVSNLIRWNWVGPLLAWISINVASFAILHDQLHLPTVATLVLSLIVGTGICWIFVLAHARGWIHDE